MDTIAWRHIRFRILPLPEIVRPRKPLVMFHIAKRGVFDPISYPRRRPVLQSNLQQNHLDANHDNGLHKQRGRIVGTEPVEHPIEAVNTFPSPMTTAGVMSYLRIDATSMINGTSNENPADVLVRCMLYIWSAYDVNGDVMRLFRVESARQHLKLVRSVWVLQDEHTTRVSHILKPKKQSALRLRLRLRFDTA